MIWFKPTLCLYFSYIFSPFAQQNHKEKAESYKKGEDNEERNENGQVFIEFLLLLTVVSVFSTLLLMGVTNLFATIWRAIIQMVVESNSISFR